MPPYLAGRVDEIREFQRLLRQDHILENMILTGLRGLGKTVLLETFNPIAIQSGWLWAGTDLSESMSVSEDNLATRLLTDLAILTSNIVIGQAEIPRIGLKSKPDEIRISLSYPTLRAVYDETPGLVADKLKRVLELVAGHIRKSGHRGIVFAYDEAQTLSDHKAKEQYPLSLLLDVFQSIQRKGVPFMLVLTGLPTLFPKLVEARTFAERMFRVVFLEPLSRSESREAILRPISDGKCPVSFTDLSVDAVWKVSAGYPYFIQYVCREVFDVWMQHLESGSTPKSIPLEEITRKLDSDFFAGRWARATDRQRDLLRIAARLKNSEAEFTVQEIVEHASNSAQPKPFSSSLVNQMLAKLAEAGLIYKNRHGKYSFAVPLLGPFILRQSRRDGSQAVLPGFEQSE
ncbi:MAG: AAA family ATPase [Planctomycetia bacterium]|nr:AAA family ATPase [Planctomycetia bacterium]